MHFDFDELIYCLQWMFNTPTYYLIMEAHYLVVLVFESNSGHTLILFKSRKKYIKHANIPKPSKKSPSLKCSGEPAGLQRFQCDNRECIQCHLSMGRVKRF